MSSACTVENAKGLVENSFFFLEDPFEFLQHQVVYNHALILRSGY